MLITADTVVTGNDILRPGWIDVDSPSGRVVAVGSGRPPRPSDPNAGDVALGAVTVVPGFVDIHVHGGGSGTFGVGEQDTRTAVELHRRHGTTSMVASLVTAQPQELLDQAALMAEQVQEGLLAGVHLEGPWLSSRRCGAHDPQALRDPDIGELTRVLRAGRGTIRMVTLAPERTGGLAAVRHLVAENVVAAVGHTDATYEQARAAIDVGATVGTHLFNAMRPVHHREPGPVIALLEDARVTVEMITDGVHLHPALYRDVTRTVGAGRVALVTDAMAAAGMADGAYRLGILDVDVVDGVARVAGTDTIAGSTATMDHVFRFALRSSSADPDTALLTAVRQSSVNPARALGLPDPTLVADAVADMVVLDSELAVTGVLHHGRWIVEPTVGSGVTETLEPVEGLVH